AKRLIAGGVHLTAPATTTMTPLPHKATTPTKTRRRLSGNIMGLTERRRCKCEKDNRRIIPDLTQTRAHNRRHVALIKGSARRAPRRQSRTTSDQDLPTFTDLSGSGIHRAPHHLDGPLTGERDPQRLETGSKLIQAQRLRDQALTVAHPPRTPS